LNFKKRYTDDVLLPWGYSSNEPTGYVYYTTRKKINEIYCDKIFPLNSEQLAEIESFKNSLSEELEIGGGIPRGKVGLGESPAILAAGEALSTSEETEGKEDSFPSALVIENTAGYEEENEQVAAVVSAIEEEGEEESLFSRLVIGREGKVASVLVNTGYKEESIGEIFPGNEKTINESLKQDITKSGLAAVSSGAKGHLRSIFIFLLLFFLVISVVILYRARRGLSLKPSLPYNPQDNIKGQDEALDTLDFYNDPIYTESIISEYNELTKDDEDKNYQETHVSETTNLDTIITPPPR